MVAVQGPSHASMHSGALVRPVRQSNGYPHDRHDRHEFRLRHLISKFLEALLLHFQQKRRTAYAVRLE
jgi:hypothetical protein